jgi:FkbM family methyltransferase
MKTGNLAVVMTAWRRPYYLRRVLESWSKVRGVLDLALFRISMDESDREDAMFEVISEYQDLASSVRVNRPALGVGGNPLQAISAVFQEYPYVEFVVLAEEDLVVSDDVLEYFTWAAGTFQKYPAMAMVCAQPRPQGTDPAVARMYHHFSNVWVWGTWRSKWASFLKPNWDYTTPVRGCPGGDWAWYLDNSVFRNMDCQSVAPDVARSQNIGELEGAHSGPADYMLSQRSSFREHQEPVGYRLELEKTRRPVMTRWADNLEWGWGGYGTDDHLAIDPHEASLEPTLRRLLGHDRPVFLDVGAHVGRWTVRLSGQAAQVIAVEANPETVEQLRRNIALNNLLNITVLGVAAWDSQTTLYLSDPNCKATGGSTRTLESGDGPEATAMPLDDLLDGIPAITLVKLDVEGADLHALRGMAKTLARTRPVLFIERHDPLGYYAYDDLLALLSELGYTWEPGPKWMEAEYLIASPV